MVPKVSCLESLSHLMVSSSWFLTWKIKLESQSAVSDVEGLSNQHPVRNTAQFRKGILKPRALRMAFHSCDICRFRASLMPRRPFGNVILPNFRLMVLTGVMPLLCVGSLRRVWMTGKVLMFRLMPGRKPFAKPNLTLPKERAGGLERNWLLYLPRHCLTSVKFFRALYRVPPGQTGWLLLARSSS